MTSYKIVTAALLSLAVAGCAETTIEGGGDSNDKTRDGGRDSKDLSQLQAGIWVDPRGCDHWIIDDGVEGYLSARLNPKTGKPVCSGAAPPGYATGEFKGGSDIADPV